MGHINYAGGMNSDRKGLIKFTGNATITSWNHYKIPLDDNYLKTLKNYKAGAYPVFSRSNFAIDGQIGDTYINMKNYVKGYVWVNGRNLGRFWNRGPQYKLFCPGVWLKSVNEIIVL
jgi:beta-galactosidase